MSCCTCPIACVPISDEAAEPVLGSETRTADGVWIRSMAVPRADTVIPQHAHRWDHTTMVAKGAVRVWQDGEELGDFYAPCGIFIRAGAKHTFLSLTDDTLLYCIHNISRTGEVEVVAEHQLIPGGV
jgi:mannose-6-phosphate isomerase-like protein (cupin superfamily)